MSYEYSEDRLIEQAAIEVLQDLGWETAWAYDRERLGEEDGTFGREARTDVLLLKPLKAALRRLNPGLPEKAYEEALNLIRRADASKDLAGNNHEKFLQYTRGIPVSYKDDRGELVKDRKLRVLDLDDYNNNNFLAVQQLWVKGPLHLRRPDVICFVNGIPLVFIELKAHHVSVEHAYHDNFRDYLDTIPHLFYHNAFVILSNGLDAKIGSITSKYDHFKDWKRIEEEEAGEISLDTMLRGTCAPHRLMDLVENFILFDTSESSTIKLVARNHQFLGVNKAIESARNIKEMDGKLGVFWHTQGSGKSYSMVFFCQKIHRKIEGNFTFVIVTDRKELDKQIYENFSGVGAVTTQQVRAESGQHLKELLRENHRYIFTLIHKFYAPKGEEYPLISERKDIIVVSDEAHRTQYGQLAYNMRNALPNASYIGFTGTPLISEDLELTRNIFGEYVSIYDFKRSIEDGATVPLYYENRGEKLKIEQPEIDEAMAEILEDENLTDDQRRKLERSFAQSYPVLTSEKRLNTIARDIIENFNERGYKGKAMVVCIDKPTAVRMYDLLMKYQEEYINQFEDKLESALDEQDLTEKKHLLKWIKETEMAVVVSQEQNEVARFKKMGLDILPHREKIEKRNLEKEFKDEDHPFRIAVVCAMWITGFDVPSLSTLYIDKPLKGHTLMQAIARANRVHEGKNNGTIFDYINVYQSLQKALSIYGEGDQRRESGDIEMPSTEAASPLELIEKLQEEVEKAILKTEELLAEMDFQLEELTNATGMAKIRMIREGMDAVCLNDVTRSDFEKLAREVFRKFRALQSNEIDLIKPFMARKNAIEAIYDGINKKVKEADITEYIAKLQRVVNEAIQIDQVEEFQPTIVDLSKLDFDKLRAWFEQQKHKKTELQAMKKVIGDKLEEMVRRNPTRINFYKRYQEIIDKYNQEKDRALIEQTFAELIDFVEDLSREEQRSMRENLDEESLAIFDLLIRNKDGLNKKERQKVKEVARSLLEKLKGEKLPIPRWKESTQLKAQVRSIILNKMYELPPEQYPDDEIPLRRDMVYQFVFEQYGGAAA